MDVVIETYHALPCATKVFTINGIDSDTSYFGEMYDVEHEVAEPYCCECMKFVANDDMMLIAMNRYGISTEEFRSIQDMLEEKMYVGTCCWCE